MPNRRYFKYLFSLFIVVISVALCEVGFRAYDYFTTPHGSETQDDWIKKVSRELEGHPQLGYRRKPNQRLDDSTQVDRFGMANTPEALGWDAVDVVGVGDSYMEVAKGVFFEQFKARGLKYHSLALFGYGPANYDVLVREYGPQLHPRVYVYATFLGNDPGDVRRFEAWRASGKGWYEHNGGYVFPIERQGLFWGWRLFTSRAKGFGRNLISRIKPDSYASLRSLVKRDDAETIFEYIVQASEMADKQQVKLLVVIIPRTVEHKPLLDPIAAKLVSLCTAKRIDCLDLDPAFGSIEGRDKLFAPDEHWNNSGMQAAWTYLWEQKLKSLLSSDLATDSARSH